MYSSAGHRQSAARISNPVWSRQNVNKQRSSAVLRDCGVIRNFQISKFIKSVRKSGAFRKEFASERERMSDSPRKNHPARQIRRGHCLTFKKNRHRDEELLEINRTVDSDNKPVITRSDNADNRTWSSQSLAQSSVTVEKIDDSFNEQTEFSKDVSRDRTFCTGKVNSECLTFSCDHEQSSVNVAGLSRDTGRGSRSSIEEYDGRQSGVLDQEQRLQGAAGCATGVPSGNATGDSSSNSSAVSSSNSTAVSSRSNSSYVSPSISTAVNLGAESSSLGIPSPENSSPGYTSSSSNSTSVSSISSPTQSSHLLSLLDQISSISCQTKDVQNIPLPTQLPLKSQASSNLPPSNERTVIGRELTPPRKDDIESNSQSSSSASSSSRRNNRKPPPSNNAQPHIESNVREEADGSEDPPDPEVEELSRMRCPSDSTEVIAERENRRRQRQRRCADYPGLAFGSSIFSSDTMMRFNLIRNELQNIRNSQLKRAESEVAALNRRIQLLEEDLERSEERLATATAKLAEASQAADESERIRKALENRTNMEDDRVALLEQSLAQAKQIAEEADKKYEEVARKLAMVEADLERAEERAESGEAKIVELEEELRVVGNNLKSLEVSEEKANQREEEYKNQIKMLNNRLKEAEARAEFAERSVQKLQKEVDRLEDELVHEKEKYKYICDDLDQTFTELVN